MQWLVFTNRLVIIMNEVLIAVLAGLVVGVVFSALKLPIPAPPVLSGVMGIVGVYIGGISYHWIIERFFS
jgi:XapX domain-containing protein